MSADTVGGKDSTAFVSATNGKAPDSELLDGKDSADFAEASTGQAFYSEGTTSVDDLITKKALPKGDCVITGSVSGHSHSEDI